MSEDSITTVCEDLLQLRDEVAQSEFRPSADVICQRLTAAVARLEACYPQPQFGGTDGSESGETKTSSAESDPEVSRETDVETTGKEISRASVFAGDEQSPKPKTVRARKSR